MSNRNLFVAMFAAAGLFGSGSALADVGQATQTKLLGSTSTDLAPVRAGYTDQATGKYVPAQLRRDRNDQPGAEQPAFAMFADGVHGLYFERRSGAINGQAPNPNDPKDVQGAMVMFHLEQDATTGAVKAVADNASFITQNRGGEYRHFNQPNAFAIDNGKAIVVEYNYRPNNRTYRYAMVFNAAGQVVMPQTKIYEKNNDDCSMNMDGHAGGVASVNGGVSHVVTWNGCNGNGQDDGWAHIYDYSATEDATGNVTAVAFQDKFDISLAQREERSRGYCSFGTDPNTAICSWTEGNNQPQRDGTWLAAIDVSPGITGQDRQDKIYWKQMVDGHKEATGDGTPATYSMRAMHERIQMPDASGNLANTDEIIWRSADVRGNNNDNRKGGTYYRDNIAVMHVDKTGMQYVVPMTDLQQTLRGIDGTHLGIGFGIFGSTDKPTPGIMLISGSHTGGGAATQITALGLDTTAGKLNMLGSYSGAPYDRHMYPNYLGQNPGNQGRDFSATLMVKNPFVGKNGNSDAYLAIMATTGKDPAEVATAANADKCYASDDTAKANPVSCAQLKLSSYLTVLPIASAPQQQTGTGTGSGSDTGGGTGMGTGSGSDTGAGSGSATQPTSGSTDPGTTLGGCSATGGAGGAMTFLLIGLAAFIRRRS